MFKKLKIKFILTNVLTSLSIILIAFSSIYLVASSSTRHQEPRPMQEIADNKVNERFDKEMEKRLAQEREAYLQSLLISLIISGIAMEIIIILLSVYLAEQSIKPVKESYESQKQFIANASHEIKTPLAVIQANLEASGIVDNKWINIATKKVEDLTSINNQLLMLAQNDQTQNTSHQTTFILNDVINDAMSSFETSAKRKSINLSKKFEQNKPISVKANKPALEQILNIYIDNGIKYAKSNVTIVVNRNSISVESDGKLISASKLPHLFERFYQSDKSSDGIGLGLAIAQSVAEKNNWKLSAKTDAKRKVNVFSLQFK